MRKLTSKDVTPRGGAPARRAAYEALRAIHTGQRDLPGALAEYRDALPDGRDRALAGEIVIGVLRWRAALDPAIQKLTRRRLDQLDPEVIDILRTSAYQLWKLSRVPPHAVVNDAVELTRAMRRGRAAGLVNAALRALTRTTIGALLPPRPDNPDRTDPVPYLTTTLSHPRWLVERWLARCGFATTERWLEFNNSHPELTLRVNTLRTTTPALLERFATAGVHAEPARKAPDALVVKSGHPLTTPEFAEGLFIVQDESSQLVAQMTGVKPDERVLDTCSSPGGKTMVMANLASGDARIVAADARHRRIALLRDTLARTGVRANIMEFDLLAGVPLNGRFDCVLLDAPCSGLGTLRRDPDIKWRRTADELPVLAASQLLMLVNASAAVADGGRLVYATCSSEPEENEHVVDRFLRETTGFSLATSDQLATLVPHWDLISRFCDQQGRFRTMPPRDGLEAFFAAVLVKARPL